MVSQSVFALRDRQRAALQACLSQPNPPEWKLLICDAFSSEVVNALFPPPALRRNAITLHTVIDAPRAPVPDVPALYLVAPTPNNIARISNDLAAKSLYHTASIVFTTEISKPLLVAFAAQLPIPSPITSLRDAHSSFISLEQNLFTLNMHNSYLQMKSVSDNNLLNAFVQTIVDGLFSVFVTLGVIPVIRSQRGGAAEVVSQSLDKRLRESLPLFQRSALSSRALSFRRPLLLMVDRDFDFNVILHHTWTYQALVHDCLKLQLNRLNLQVADGGGVSTATLKTYNLDKGTDEFWRSHAASPFPIVAERIEEALGKYRSDVEEINRKASGHASPTDGEGTSNSVQTSHLASAIATLPELSKRKETIDIHTNIATALLDNINKRSLDAFFELECQLMSEAYRPVASLSAQEYKGALLELLTGTRETDSGEKQGEGTIWDRLRLFLIYYSVFGRSLSEKDIAEFRGVLHSVGIDTTIIDLYGKMKGYRHDLVSSKPPPEARTTKAARLTGLMKTVVDRGYRSITNVAQNAKKLIAEQKMSCATARTLEIFMSEQARGRREISASDVLDGYLLFDPKTMPAATSINTSSSTTSGGIEVQKEQAMLRKMRRMEFSDAIVFTVGGGNYVEYDNCMDSMASLTTSTSKKSVLYGTTEMITAEGFLQQLTEVSKRPR